MRTRMKRTMVIWCVISLTLLLVSSGYAQKEPKLEQLVKAARGEGELNLVAGGGTWGEAEGVKIIQDALNKKYNLNIRIRYAAGPSMAVMPSRIIPAYKAGAKSDTDVYVGSAVHMPLILDAGLARSFPWLDVFPYMPRETVEFEGKIIRFADVFDGITYNTREITGSNVPSRLEDVLDPKWKGKIASTPYASALYYLATERMWGYEKAASFVRALSGQIGGLIRCGEEPRIASGEFLMLVMNCGNYGPDSYAQKTGAPVGTLIPEDAPVMHSFYYVVPKNAEHPNLATLLVGFLMSKEGQDILYRVVGWTSSEIEGTAVNKKYSALKGKGIKVQKFTAASYTGKEGPILGKANDEFKKILSRR